MSQTARTAFHVRLLGVGIGACILAAVPLAGARAQAGLMNGPASGGGSLMQHGVDAGSRAEKREPLPDSLPGAKARAPIVPASKTPSDMSPNDAMFDAINRGDITTVKDALSRGAQVDARNVLGMTPLELSVDLGRNDISFLLLSMRGPSAPPSASSSGKQMTQKATAAEIKAAQLARRPARAAPAPASVAAKPVSAPKLFANDGGSPVPNAGFLGFDSHGSTN